MTGLPPVEPCVPFLWLAPIVIVQGKNIKVHMGNQIALPEIENILRVIEVIYMENKQIIQQISTICDNLPTKMKWAKEEQHKTNQQIIDSTGLSESMVKKFFSGHLTGPSIYDVTAIAIDLGLSLDELMELSPPKQDQSAEIERLKTEISHKEELISEKDNAISRLEERSRMMERELFAVRSSWRRITYGAAGLATLFGACLIIYVFLDMKNPNLGLFRGTRSSPVVYAAAFAIAGVCLFVCRKMVKKRMEQKKNANDTH